MMSLVWSELAIVVDIMVNWRTILSQYRNDIIIRFISQGTGVSFFILSS